MKPHLLAAFALGALAGIAFAQSSGSDTATPAVPNDGEPRDAFNSPAVPGDPATRLPPHVPATPSPPSTPVDMPPVNADAGKAAQSCNALADEGARKKCLMESGAGSSRDGNAAEPKGGAAAQRANTPIPGGQPSGASGASGESR